MSTTNPTVSTVTRNYSVGYKPKQNIPESQKGEDWAMDNVDWCISMLPVFTKRQIDSSYDLYNGFRSPEDFLHITETYGIEMPAGKLKHIPLIRPMINELVSEMEERELKFSLFSEDPDSVAEKVQELSGRILQDVAFIIKTARSEEELEMALDSLEREYKRFQTETEINSLVLLKNYILRNRVDRKLIEAWLDKLISGFQFVRVNLERRGEDPIFTVIRPGDLYYADNDVRWVSECDWGVYVKEMTPTEILDTYGDRMKPGDIKKIEDWLDMYHKDAWYKLGPGETMDDLLKDTGMVNNSAINHKIHVYHVEWKSIREISFLKSDNKYNPDDPFLKHIPDEQIYQLPNSRRKKIEKRYVQDLWHGVRIGDEIYVDLGKYPYPQRSIASPSKVLLTFEGPTFNGKIRPYSLIKETRDLQDLYDIMHWHKENLIALSGVKGSFMDISQLPDFFNGEGKLSDNIRMWFYYRKLGAAFINRMQEGADRTYNQFSNYDDTLGAGLEAILLTIQHLEDAAARITGVNRQRMGQIKQYDGKGNVENAQQTSTLITEYLFNQHDEFVERVLTSIINKLRVAYPEGVQGSFTGRDGQSQVFRLDERFPLSDYSVYLTTKKSDSRKIEELKAQSYEMVKGGVLAAEDMFRFFKRDSFPQILQEIEDSVIKRRQEMQQMQQRQQQIMEQLETATAQAEIQKLQAQAGELQAKIDKYAREIAVDERALEIQREANIGKLENDKARVALEAKQLDVAANQKAIEVRNK